MPDLLLKYVFFSRFGNHFKLFQNNQIVLHLQDNMSFRSQTLNLIRHFFIIIKPHFDEDNVA